MEKQKAQTNEKENTTLGKRIIVFFFWCNNRTDRERGMVLKEYGVKNNQKTKRKRRRKRGGE